MKNTKRALLTSALAIVACAAMLIGATFAWFTDTASTSVNRIVAGQLKVKLQKNVDGEWVDLGDEPLSFLRKTGDPNTSDAKVEDESILWEPGCTYELPTLRVVNDGNLALKYKVLITGIGGDAMLNKAIEWTMTLDGKDFAADAEQHLLPKADHVFTLSGHMKETAGNEYQGKWIDDITITVVATQDTVEHDSFGSDYDADATYPIFDAASFKKALDEVNASDNVHKAILAVTKDLTYDDVALEVADGKDIRIDLGGNDLTLKNNKGDGITVGSGATLTLADSTGTGTYVFDNSASGSDGIFVSNTEDGKTTTLNIEGNVQINVDSKANSAIHAYAPAGNAVVNIKDAQITINGDKQTSAIVIDQNATLNMDGGVLDIHADFNTYSDGNDVVGILLWGQNGKQENSTVNMTGGTIRVGGKNAFVQGIQIGMKNGYSQDLNVNISGGKIELAPTENGKGYAFTTYKDVYGKFTMSGGEVSGNITALALAYIGDVDLTVTGGTFGVDPTDYVAEGCTAEKTGNVWTVK